MYVSLNKNTKPKLYYSFLLIGPNLGIRNDIMPRLSILYRGCITLFTKGSGQRRGQGRAREEDGRRTRGPVQDYQP